MSREEMISNYRPITVANCHENASIREDIGSGLNMNRKGLLQLLEYVIDGKVEEIVIAYKDRLTRFGYELTSIN